MSNVSIHEQNKNNISTQTIMIYITHNEQRRDHILKQSSFTNQIHYILSIQTSVVATTPPCFPSFVSTSSVSSVCLSSSFFPQIIPFTFELVATRATTQIASITRNPVSAL